MYVEDDFEPHPSHEMGPWRSTVVTITETSRFGSLRECQNCGAEEAKTVCGHAAHDELARPCAEAKKAKSKKAKAKKSTEALVSDLGMLADTLNELLERAEQVLGRHGVPGSVKIGDDKVLGLKRVGHQWRLVWVTAEASTLVQHSSRQSRVLAAQSVAKLDEVLKRESLVYEGRVRKTIESLEAWLETVERSPDA